MWSFEAGCIYMTAVEVAFQLGKVMGKWLVEKGKVEGWLVIYTYIHIYIYTYIHIYIYTYIHIIYIYNHIYISDFSKRLPPERMLRMLDELNDFGSVSKTEMVKKCPLQNMSIDVSFAMNKCRKWKPCHANSLPFFHLRIARLSIFSGFVLQLRWTG